MTTSIGSIIIILGFLIVLKGKVKYQFKTLYMHEVCKHKKNFFTRLFCSLLIDYLCGFVNNYIYFVCLLLSVNLVWLLSFNSLLFYQLFKLYIYINQEIIKLKKCGKKSLYYSNELFVKKTL